MSSTAGAASTGPLRSRHPAAAPCRMGHAVSQPPGPTVSAAVAARRADGGDAGSDPFTAQEPLFACALGASLQGRVALGPYSGRAGNCDVAVTGHWKSLQVSRGLFMCPLLSKRPGCALAAMPPDVAESCRATGAPVLPSVPLSDGTSRGRAQGGQLRRPPDRAVAICRSDRRDPPAGAGVSRRRERP
jgi:hypothetical protein